MHQNASSVFSAYRPLNGSYGTRKTTKKRRRRRRNILKRKRKEELNENEIKRWTINIEGSTDGHIYVYKYLQIKERK